MCINKLFAEIDRLKTLKSSEEWNVCALAISRILGSQPTQIHYLDDNQLQVLRSHDDLKSLVDQFQGGFSLIGLADFPTVSVDGCEKDTIYSFVCKNEGNNSFSFPSDWSSPSSSTALLFNFQKFLQEKTGIRLKEEEAQSDIAVLNWGKSFQIKELGGAETIPIEGFNGSTSFHFALLVSFFSQSFDLPIPASYVFSGDFDKDGNAVRVTDVKRKLECIRKLRPRLVKFFVPSLALLDPVDRDFLSDAANRDYVVEIKDWKELIEKVFGKELDKLLCVTTEKKHHLGKEFLECIHIGEKDIEFTHPYLHDIIRRTFTVVRLSFSRNQNPPNFDIFPLDYLKFSFEYSSSEMLAILEGNLVNHYTARHFIMRPQRPEFAAIYIRTGAGNCYFVDGGRKNQHLVGYQFKPPWQV